MDIAPFRREVVSAALAVREKAPLVHNITNYVVMQVSANVLLAAGASPLMAHAPEELDDLLAVASALVLNIGTPDQAWLDSMFLAGECAARRGVPVVLDPVGAGASRLRTDAALNLLRAARPAVLRGNGSEILALAAAEGLSSLEAATRGVDSTKDSAGAVAAGPRAGPAQRLRRQHQRRNGLHHGRRHRACRQRRFAPHEPGHGHGLFGQRAHRRSCGRGRNPAGRSRRGHGRHGRSRGSGGKAGGGAGQLPLPFS